ncbi:unnamed protein product [Symbiodinium sp. CCMP2592]|nr:unnamed protein product [Symbiodinium sp. CCMP2592]
MGYEGLSSTFLRREALMQAFSEQGAILDYFRGWNTSWTQPWKYFDSIASVNRSQMVPCNASRFTITQANRDYLQVTGDTAGVAVQPNGELFAVCPDGYYWPPPSCRAVSSRCVPYFTQDPGWGLDDMMQKVTAYGMPISLGVAKSWAEMALQVNSLFYWWTPDTTFLAYDPVHVKFPPYDPNAYLRGDKRSTADATFISKIVSQDLSAVAPKVKDFVGSMRFGLSDVMGMMQDKLATGDSHLDVACRWIHANVHAWELWLPDKTKCAPGFGLFDTRMSEFTSDRSDHTFLECRACVSGLYSVRLDDSQGITHVCKPCKPGTRQASGAALRCDLCQPGEFQDKSGSKSCVRCNISYYQDQLGSVQCKPCPSGTTLGFGSVSVADCGCEAGFINTASSPGSLKCTECGEGLRCPVIGAVDALVTGTAELGESFVPEVLPNYYSALDKPLDVYRCVGSTRCPGGKPGSCSTGLQGVACTDCPESQTWDGESCKLCTRFQQSLWILAVLAFGPGLIAAYYVQEFQARSVASVSARDTGVCAFAMTFSNLQCVGMVGLMMELPNLASILVLDIEDLGFNCVAGRSASWRYSVKVLLVPFAALWLVACYLVSQLLPARLQEYRWKGPETRSTIGLLLLLGFNTMCTVAVMPLMCFSHPSGASSLLKYPSITCASDQHFVMMILGLLVLLFALGFVAACTYATFAAPGWSRGHCQQKSSVFSVKSFRFLVFRFRLDCWWFGVPLLLRGSLMSLPMAVATNYPAVQVLMWTLVLLIFLVVAVWVQPWKVPLLNVFDCVMHVCIVMVVAARSLDVGLKDDAVAVAVAAAASLVVMWTLSATVLILFLVTGRAVMTSRGDLKMRLLNLQSLPPKAAVADRLKATAALLAVMEDVNLQSAIQDLPLYDRKLLLASLSMLALEVLPDTKETKVFNARIQSVAFSPDRPDQPGSAVSQLRWGLGSTMVQSWRQAWFATRKLQVAPSFTPV